MKPVTQTIFNAERGDCFAACLASILELELDEVPNFHGENWLFRYNRWLKPFNLVLYDVTFPKGTNQHPVGYSILAGTSPRYAPALHAVVCLDGTIVHDPHPNGEPVLDRKCYTIIALRDPALGVTLQKLKEKKG